jgi:hypothetical protein
LNEDNKTNVFAPGRDNALFLFRVAWTAFIVLAVSVPYLLNWLATPSGFHYTWILPPYPEDSFAYMGWSQQAAHGDFLFKLKYTALPHSAFLFHPFFLLCGWVCALTGCEPGVVHWVVKAFGAGLLLWVFFKYIDWLGLSRLQSVVASVLVGLSSGVGGLIGWFGDVEMMKSLRPADTWMPETSTFWALLWNPLFPFSLTTLLLAVFWLDRGTCDGRKRDAWLSGLAAGVLALLHPYSVPVVFAWAVIVTFLRRRAEALQYLWRFFVAALPPVLYVAVLSLSNSVVSRHNAMGAMQSPSLASYLAGFGLPLLLCLAGLAVGRSSMFKNCWQLVLWFGRRLGFAYLPVWFQRKLIFGAHIPLCIVGGIAVEFILRKIGGTRGAQSPTNKGFSLAVVQKVGIASVFVFLLASTQIYLLLRESQRVKANETGAYYVSDDVMSGLNFLRRKTNPHSVVCATIPTSRFIPALAGNTVIWGHWAMSVDAEARKQWFDAVFSPSSTWPPDRKVREFWGTGIEYIFADGSFAQTLRSAPAPWDAILKQADKVYENNSVVIYRKKQSKA